MRFFLLFFLLLSSCERYPKGAPPYTWRPLLCDDPFSCKGKVRKRPLYKARVPLQWTGLPQREHTTFQIEDGVEVVFRQISQDKTKSFTTSFNTDFLGYVEKMENRVIWTLIPRPEIRKTLLKPGQNPEEELFFSLLAAPFQIEFSAPKDKKDLYLSEVEDFISSLTFVQGLPS